MRVKKYTEDQLSRALSHAHELERGGVTRVVSSVLANECGCVNQVAYNIPCAGLAGDANDPVAEAFDNGHPTHTPDSLLRLLEKVGAA